MNAIGSISAGAAAHGARARPPDLLMPFGELNDLMGLTQLRALERSFAAAPKS